MPPLQWHKCPTCLRERRVTKGSKMTGHNRWMRFRPAVPFLGKMTPCEGSLTKAEKETDNGQ